MNPMLFILRSRYFYYSAVLTLHLLGVSLQSFQVYYTILRLFVGYRPFFRKLVAS